MSDGGAAYRRDLYEAIDALKRFMDKQRGCDIDGLQSVLRAAESLLYTAITIDCRRGCDAARTQTPGPSPGVAGEVQGQAGETSPAF